MEIIQKYRQYTFLPATFFSYDAAAETINYDPDRIQSHTGKISLLHEISHCKLGHFHYQYDVELLAMEIAAWRLTRVLAQKHHVTISKRYIQRCIDSYNDWVNARGSCPTCSNFCLQSEQNAEIFACFVCNTRWKIASGIHDDIKKIILTS